tara:strand:- start:129 stop:407 length:279 start_codon:yes stop_codon:yes gene_type:complete
LVTGSNKGEAFSFVFMLCNSHPFAYSQLSGGTSGAHVRVGSGDMAPKGLLQSILLRTKLALVRMWPNLLKLFFYRSASLVHNLFFLNLRSPM